MQQDAKYVSTDSFVEILKDAGMSHINISQKRNYIQNRVDFQAHFSFGSRLHLHLPILFSTEAQLRRKIQELKMRELLVPSPDFNIKDSAHFEDLETYKPMPKSKLKKLQTYHYAPLEEN